MVIRSLAIRTSVLRATVVTTSPRDNRSMKLGEGLTTEVLIPMFLLRRILTLWLVVPRFVLQVLTSEVHTTKVLSVKVHTTDFISTNVRTTDVLTTKIRRVILAQ